MKTKLKSDDIQVRLDNIRQLIERGQDKIDQLRLVASNPNENGRWLLACGEALDVRYSFDKARTILSFDADFLGAGNARVRAARDFAQGRGAGGRAEMQNRLYAMASSPSLTSAIADHCAALRATDIEGAARRVAKLLGLPVVAPETVAGALAASAGLCPSGTRLAPRALVAGFDLDKVDRAPVVMDGEVLT